MLYVSDMHTYLDAVLLHVKSEQSLSRSVYEFYQCYTSVLCIQSLNLCYSMFKVNKFAPWSVLENPVFVLLLMSTLYRQVPLLRHIVVCKITGFRRCLCVYYTCVICAHILMLCDSMSKVNKVVPCNVLGKHVFIVDIYVNVIRQ